MTVEQLVKLAENRMYNDYRIHAGIERKVNVKTWEKDGKKRAYITIQCYTMAGNYKGAYKCGYLDKVTGEYVFTKYDDIDLTSEYRKDGVSEWIDPMQSIEKEKPEEKAEQITLNGTEKQIAWATEIKETVISILREAIGHADYQDEEKTTAFKNAIETRITALETAEYAGDIIFLFKDIRKTGNYMVDVRKLLAEYQTSVPCNEGQKKILCK